MALGLVTTGLGLGAMLTSGCSGKSSESETSLVSGACAGGDATCAPSGAECEVDADCASHACSGGACAAPGAGGAGGGPVTPVGNGAGGGLILDSDFEPSSGQGTDVCVDLAVDFEPITPSVVLLIDRSGSMIDRFDGSRNRWETLVQTLTDPSSSMLQKLEGSVRFGMALYTSDNGFGPDKAAPHQCPILTNVDIALGNFASMASVLSDPANKPFDDTPTAESLAAVAAQLAAFDAEGPKSIILATDGDPDTCADPDANNKDTSKALSVAAVTAAREQGISTYVISVGDEATASHLKALAVAGAGGDTKAEAYTALDTAALENAFNQIIGSVRPCDFKLDGTVEAEDASRGSVLIDGEALAFGDANGWVMPDESTVRLQGQACEAVQGDASGISMSFPCDAIQIIPR
jgi:von Willebrand factor type A domain-containing protein